MSTHTLLLPEPNDFKSLEAPGLDLPHVLVFSPEENEASQKFGDFGIKDEVNGVAGSSELCEATKCSEVPCERRVKLKGGGEKCALALADGAGCEERVTKADISIKYTP